MRCPFCLKDFGGTANVLETRFVDGVSRRRRECPFCSKRFTTYEIPKDEYDSLKKTEQKFLQLQVLLSRIEKSTGLRQFKLIQSLRSQATTNP